MNATRVREAGRIIHSCWDAGSVIDGLPERCRPATPEAGYEIQQAFVRHSGDAVVGWKIAATSRAGQRHINVDGPIAGRLLKSRVQDSPGRVHLGLNRMGVAEAEFAFVLGRPLPARAAAYTEAEAFAAVADVHPAIEIPDSRYLDFARAGGPQLIADNACASLFILGTAASPDLRSMDFAAHPVRLIIDGVEATSGTGADALGDPRTALAWIANNHAQQGKSLDAGDIITTGVCGQPSAIKPGNRVVADFGPLGTAETALV